MNDTVGHEAAILNRWLQIDLEAHARRLYECIARCVDAGAVPTDETLRTITACYGDTVIDLQRERHPDTPAVMDFREAFAERPLQPLEVEQRQRYSADRHGAAFATSPLAATPPSPPADTAEQQAAIQDRDRNANHPLHLTGLDGMTRCEVRYGAGVRVADGVGPATLAADDLCSLCADVVEVERRAVSDLHQAIETARERAMETLQDGQLGTAATVEAIEAARLAQIAADQALRAVGGRDG